MCSLFNVYRVKNAVQSVEKRIDTEHNQLIHEHIFVYTFIVNFWLAEEEKNAKQCKGVEGNSIPYF